jgi:hypothetical protein
MDHINGFSGRYADIIHIHPNVLFFLKNKFKIFVLNNKIL